MGPPCPGSDRGTARAPILRDMASAGACTMPFPWEPPLRDPRPHVPAQTAAQQGQKGPSSLHIDGLPVSATGQGPPLAMEPPCPVGGGREDSRRTCPQEHRRGIKGLRLPLPPGIAVFLHFYQIPCSLGWGPPRESRPSPSSLCFLGRRWAALLNESAF